MLSAPGPPLTMSEPLPPLRSSRPPPPAIRSGPSLLFDHVTARSSEQSISKRGAHNHDAPTGLNRVVTPASGDAGAEIHRDGTGRTPEADSYGVVASTSRIGHQEIVASSTAEHVRETEVIRTWRDSGTPGQQPVGTAAAPDHISTVIAAKHIVSAAAIDEVVPVETGRSHPGPECR